MTIRTPPLPILTDRARQMRKQPTEAERQLWQRLRNRQFFGVKFKRQFTVGHYIADFCSEMHRVIVEADGNQHGDNAYDRARDEWFAAQGFRVCRFANEDILANMESVLATLARDMGFEF